MHGCSDPIPIPGPGLQWRPAGLLAVSAGMRLGRGREPGAGKRCVILRSLRAPPEGPKRTLVSHSMLPGAAQRSAGPHPHPLGLFGVHRNCG